MLENGLNVDYSDRLKKIINADVNGAYNIIKKAIPKAFINVEADRIEGVGLHPLRCVL